MINALKNNYITKVISQSTRETLRFPLNFREFLPKKNCAIMLIAIMIKLMII